MEEELEKNLGIGDKGLEGYIAIVFIISILAGVT
jgi:hypothetical protein